MNARTLTASFLSYAFVSSLPSLGFVSPDAEAQWYTGGGVNDVRAQCSLLGASCCVLAPVCHHTNTRNIFIVHVSV